MKETKKCLCLVIVILISLSIFLIGCKKNSVTTTWDLPAFYTQESENNELHINLNEMLKKPGTNHVLLYVWSKVYPTELDPELALMQLDLFKFENNKKRLTVIGINNSKSFDTLSKTIDYFISKNFRLDFPLLWDKKGLIANQYGTSNAPTCILLNKKGEIVIKREVYNYDGFETLLPKLQEILNKGGLETFDA